MYTQQSLVNTSFCLNNLYMFFSVLTSLQCIVDWRKIERYVLKESTLKEPFLDVPKSDFQDAAGAKVHFLEHPL